MKKNNNIQQQKKHITSYHKKLHRKYIPKTIQHNTTTVQHTDTQPNKKKFNITLNTLYYCAIHYYTTH